MLDSAHGNEYVPYEPRLRSSTMLRRSVAPRGLGGATLQRSPTTRALASRELLCSVEPRAVTHHIDFEARNREWAEKRKKADVVFRERMEKEQAKRSLLRRDLQDQGSESQSFFARERLASEGLTHAFPWLEDPKPTESGHSQQRDLSCGNRWLGQNSADDASENEEVDLMFAASLSMGGVERSWSVSDGPQIGARIAVPQSEVGSPDRLSPQPRKFSNMEELVFEPMMSPRRVAVPFGTRSRAKDEAASKVGGGSGTSSGPPVPHRPPVFSRPLVSPGCTGSETPSLIKPAVSCARLDCQLVQLGTDTFDVEWVGGGDLMDDDDDEELFEPKLKDQHKETWDESSSLLEDLRQETFDLSELCEPVCRVNTVVQGDQGSARSGRCCLSRPGKLPIGGLPPKEFSYAPGCPFVGSFGEDATSRSLSRSSSGDSTRSSCSSSSAPSAHFPVPSMRSRSKSASTFTGFDKTGTARVPSLVPGAVTLHVYDLTDITRVWGVPLFHVSIEVFRRERFFGPLGIVSASPGKHCAHMYRECVPLGRTSLTKVDVRILLESLKDEWHPGGYSLLGRNCQTFAVAFAEQLGVGDKIPAWCRRFSKLSSIPGAEFLTALAPERRLPATACRRAWSASSISRSPRVGEVVRL